MTWSWPLFFLGFVGGVLAYFAVKILFNLALDLFDYLSGSSE